MEGQKHPNSHGILTVVYDIKKKQLYQYWKNSPFSGVATKRNSFTKYLISPILRR